MTRPWGGPSVKVPWTIQDEPWWGDNRAVAKYLRGLFEADAERRRRRRYTIPGSVWATILGTFGHRCAYCGVSGVPLEREHRVPIARGGSQSPDNIVPACRPCNSRKGASDPAGWPLVVVPS